MKLTEAGVKINSGGVEYESDFKVLGQPSCTSSSSSSCSVVGAQQKENGNF